MWELGRLPEVRSPVSLRPSEVCHLVANTIWLERKTVRTRVGYSGLAYTLPIARGLHYRIGNVSPTYNEDVSLVQVDTGKLIFTSQRVIFIGVQGTKSFAWSKVLSVTPWSDAVELARSSGKHPVFPLGDAESAVVIATSILSRA